LLIVSISPAFSKLGLDISGIDVSERIRDYAPKTISKLAILDFSRRKFTI